MAQSYRSVNAFTLTLRSIRSSPELQISKRLYTDLKKHTEQQ